MTPRTLIARAPTLPTPAPLVTRLLGLLGQADVDNDAITALVRQDPVLSARLLSLCNSAAYGLAEPVGSVDQAVLRLGHRQIHRLVLSLGLGSTLAPSLSNYELQAGLLWRHSLLTAHLVPLVLSTGRDLGFDASLGYTAGLLHDLGKLVLNHALAGASLRAVQTLLTQEDISLIEAERTVLGTDHAEVGAILLADWRFPAVLCEAVAHHHAPVSAPQPLLSSVVHVADFLALGVAGQAGLGGLGIRLDPAAIAALDLDAPTLELLVLNAYDCLAAVDTLSNPA